MTTEVGKSTGFPSPFCEGLLAHSQRGYSPSAGEDLATGLNEEAEILWGTSPSPLFVQSRMEAHSMRLPTFRMGLPSQRPDITM